MIIKDLSQSYKTGMPHAPTIPALSIQQIKSIPRDGLSVTQLSLATHIGTHIDAQTHFIEDGVSIDQIPLDVLIGPAVCVSVEKAGAEEIRVQELDEAARDALPGDALLIRTGWGAKFWTEEYNDHPYLSEDAARWIVDRRFRLVGLDTITPDLPGHLRSAGFNFPVHNILLGNGVLVMEHLFLEEVIGQRFELFIGALKIAGGDGAPARVLAVLEH
jgi:kynurenine formamidase